MPNSHESREEREAVKGETDRQYRRRDTVQDTVECMEQCSRVERESGAAQRGRRRQCYQESFTEMD